MRERRKSGAGGHLKTRQPRSKEESEGGRNVDRGRGERTGRGGVRWCAIPTCVRVWRTVRSCAEGNTPGDVSNGFKLWNYF